MYYSYLQGIPTLREKKIAVQTLLVSTSFRIFLLALIAIVGMLYVLQTTRVSTKGYAISDLEKKLTHLEHETKKLDVQIAEQQSMQNIQERLKQANMVPASEIVFIKTGADAVAKR